MIVWGHLAASIAQLPAEVGRAYFTLAAWSACREEVSGERYLRDVLGSHDPADLWPLDYLSAMGLIVTPEEAEVRYEAWMEAAYSDEDDLDEPMARRPKTPRIVVPDPFPRFLDRKWSGIAATPGETLPREKVAAVYHLYGPDDELVYVGSSSNVRKRLSNHSVQGWSRFVARECVDADAALWLEAVEVMTRQPPANRDMNVSGRVPALIAHQQAHEDDASLTCHRQ